MGNLVFKLALNQAEYPYSANTTFVLESHFPGWDPRLGKAVYTPLRKITSPVRNRDVLCTYAAYRYF